jgi:porin
MLSSLLLAAAGIGVATCAQAADKPKSIWERDTFSGDWNGARSALADSGLEFTLQYAGEGFGVGSGGIYRRSSYEGRLEFSGDLNLEKFMGWRGASMHATWFWIHNSGHNVAEHVGSISDPSNIDATPTTRLFTAWFQQDFNSIASLRVGQLDADAEFFTSDTAGGLLNGTFGWGDILAANITNGGPAYPLAAPAVRLKVNPTAQTSVLVGVFSGDPVGKPCALSDPQLCNPHGTNFSTYGGALWIGELHYKLNQGEHAVGLPGVYKIGGWYATADYPDQHYGINATGGVISLGVDSTATPVPRKGDWGIYAIADQTVWQQGERSMSLFVRTGFSPSDRNLLSWYVDGGAGFKGLIPGRPADVLTFGVAYANISDDAAAADADALAFNGPPGFIRDYEMVLEVNYAYQVAPWWIVKPDFQYIVHPGGNVAHPDNPNQAVKDAAVFGVRSTFTF